RSTPPSTIKSTKTTRERETWDGVSTDSAYVTERPAQGLRSPRVYWSNGPWRGLRGSGCGDRLISAARFAERRVSDRRRVEEKGPPAGGQRPDPGGQRPLRDARRLVSPAVRVRRGGRPRGPPLARPPGRRAPAPPTGPP